MRKRIGALIILCLCVCMAYAADESVTTGINLLNEFTYYTTLVKKEKSRIGLDSLYEDLLNNYSPKNIDEATNERMKNILNSITGLKIIDLKRERLEILYDYKKATAISSAIPSPLLVIGSIKNIVNGVATGEEGVVDIITGISMLTSAVTSSVLNYNSSKATLVSEFLAESYELDYQQIKTIDSLRIDSLSYQNTYAHANGVEDEYVLNEQLAERFVDCILETNKMKALDYLESRIDTYRYFPRFWLELADLYYQTGNYRKCIDTIEYYDQNFDYKQIYKKNIRYGQVLAEGISSCLMLIADNYELKDKVLAWLEIVIDQTADDDWYQRYFCAMVYLFFGDDSTSGIVYKRRAYDLLKMNVNTLYNRQKKLNEDYIEDYKKPSNDDYKKMTSAQEADTKAWYKTLAEERKKLPQIDPAFIENVSLVIQLIQYHKVGDISDIAYISDVILSPQLRAYLIGDKYAEGSLFGYNEEDFKLSMVWLFAFGNHIELTIPVALLNDCSRFFLKYDNQSEYTEFWNPYRKEMNVDSLRVAKMHNVTRNGKEFKDFNVKISFDLDNEWKNNATDSDGFECYFIIETNGCPIELFFAGKSAFDCSLVSMTKVFDSTNAGFYSNFEKITW